MATLAVTARKFPIVRANTVFHARYVVFKKMPMNQTAIASHFRRPVYKTFTSLVSGGSSSGSIPADTQIWGT